jgi:hypothetical protein
MKAIRNIGRVLFARRLMAGRYVVLKMPKPKPQNLISDKRLQGKYFADINYSVKHHNSYVPEFIEYVFGQVLRGLAY